MDKKDEIILQQLEVIRTMTERNLRSMGDDFWGTPFEGVLSPKPPSAPPSGGKPVGSADGKMPAQPSDGKTAGGQPAAKAEKTEVVEPLPKEDMKDLQAELDSYIGAKFAEQLRSDVELVEGVYDEFDREAYLRGELAPVFFGSAVNNFGVRELLECFVRIAPSPRPAPTATRTVEPAEPKMTGFVFKIHANMDPNHRDRIAFLKICSGTFERNHNYLHVRSGKQLKFSSPTAFMAEKKSVIDFAYPGDIVGLHDTGNFKIGDTFTEGEKLKFTGIPSFAPEQFRYIENADPLKFKQLAKGVDQLMDEGVAQLFVSSLNGRKIIGTVGALQFEVIQYRLEHEYNAACRWEPISIYKACWIESDNAAQLADFKRRKHTNMAVDKHGRDVFLADTSYGLALAQENFKDIRFHFTSEF